jgi:hypothetical protein
MKLRAFAWIALMVCVAPAVARANDPVLDGLRLVQRFRDAATGAEIRVLRGSGRELQIEVESDDLLIRKHVTGSTMRLTLVGGEDRLTMAVGPESIVVTGRDQEVKATRQSTQHLKAAQTIVAQSTVAARAAALLSRVVIREDSPLVQSLLTTRAMLESASGGGTRVIAELQAWNGRLRERLAVRKVSVQKPGPGDCWQQYAKEAIAAWTEYEHCMADTSWWEIFDKAGCALVYDTRAIGAFLWYLDCIGVLSEAQA